MMAVYDRNITVGDRWRELYYRYCMYGVYGVRQPGLHTGWITVWQIDKMTSRLIQHYLIQQLDGELDMIWDFLNWATVLSST